MSWYNVIKSIALPKGATFRRLPWGPAAGVTMKIDFAHQARLYFGVYELEIARFIRRLVQRGARCFDVGADAGYYSLLLARLSGEPIVAFDADLRAVERVRENFAHNRFDLTIYQATVGDCDGEGVITLDTAAAETFVPDFIKMDIEGAEVAALRGADGILRRRRPHLIVEVHGRDRERECVDLLGHHGYRPERIAPRRLFKETRPADHNGWLVCEGSQ